MFIPRGTILHENLATSYVLVDGLVADLCEGGFSGVVEVTLRQADAYIIIARGRVAASLLARHREAAREAGEYSRTGVAQIAEAARGERGRLSVYRYSADNAEAIAGRATAEALYTRLSTEFADLEKVIAKLSRESDREWFIEITMASGQEALVHFKGDRCRVLTARDGALVEAYESPTGAENAALLGLLDESRQLGGVFDVYFRNADDAPAGGESSEASGEELHTPAAGDISEVVREAKAVFHSLSLDDTTPAPNNGDAADHLEVTGTMAGPPSPPSPADGRRAADDLLLMPDDLRATGLLKRGSRAEVLAEIKRLMGEMVRTVEESVRAAGCRDGFGMHLRAGQLKVADRFPFLDPFGSEFEYLAGEIVFVGDAGADVFVAGLSEALAEAIDNAARASAQPARVRLHAAEGLRWLLNRQRAELEPYCLDEAIEAIMASADNRSHL